MTWFLIEDQGTPFDPSDISGLVLDLRSDDTNLVLSGSEVTQWTDLSGNGNHATADSDFAGTTPNRVVSGIEGATSVRFSANNSDRLEVPSDPSFEDWFATGGYVAFRGRLTSLEGTGSRLWSQGANGTLLRVQESGAGEYRFEFQAKHTGATGVWLWHSVTIPLGTVITLEVEYNASSPTNLPTLRINGVEQTRTTSQSPSGTYVPPTQDTWLNGASILGFSMTSDWRYFLLYDEIPSSAEKADLRTFLAQQPEPEPDPDPDPPPPSGDPLADSYFVSTTGNDTTGDGSEGNPWATYAKAKAEMRLGSIKRTYFIQGVYEFTSPDTLDANDDGVQILAYPGHDVRFTGGTRETGWTDNGDGTWSKSIGTAPTNTVTIDGARVPIASLVPVDYGNPWLTGWTMTDQSPGSSYNSVKYTSASAAAIEAANGKRLWIDYGHGGGASWNWNVHPQWGGLVTINTGSDIITLGRTVRKECIKGFFRLQGWADWISQDNSWGYEPVGTIITIRPPSGVNPNVADVRIARSTGILTLNGCDGVTIGGIQFDTIEMDDTTNSIASGEHCPMLDSHVALRMIDATNCEIHRNTFDSVSWALQLRRSSYNEIYDNHFENIGYMAIWAGRYTDQQTPSFSNVVYEGVTYSIDTEFSNFNKVKGNTGKWIGVQNRWSAGIMFLGGFVNEVMYNYFEQCARYGISFSSFGGPYTDGLYLWTPFRYNKVWYNHVKYACQCSDDGGGIHTLGRPQNITDSNYQTDHDERYNISEEVPGRKSNPNSPLSTDLDGHSESHKCYAYYNDDRSWGMLKFGCVGINGGRENFYTTHGGGNARVENCVGIMDSPSPNQVRWESNNEQHPSGLVYVRNIFSSQGGAGGAYVSITSYGSGGTFPNQYSDFNVLHNYTRQTDKNTANDANSVLADPLFVDPANGNYRLQAGSPAYSLGFVDIPWDDIGPQGFDTASLTLNGGLSWTDITKAQVRNGPFG